METENNRNEENNVPQLMVAALQRGTAIDHIPSKHLFEVVRILGLDRLDENAITIGNNLRSKQMKSGSKGLIKVADKFFEEDERNIIALFAPDVVFNEIENYKVERKLKVKLPDSIVGLVSCVNPKCITNNEPMQTRFKVIDKKEGSIQCHYCGRKINPENIILK